MSSSEIFAALFELELTGKVRQMPGKNFVKSFELRADSFHPVTCCFPPIRASFETKS